MSNKRAVRATLCRVWGLTRRPFVRGVVSVAAGTAAAQLIHMAISPVTTRLYGPEAYGVLNVFISTTGLLAPLAGLTYNHAIALPKDDRDAFALFDLSVRISAAVFVVLAVVFALFPEGLADLMRFPGAPWMLLLVAPVVFLNGLMASLSQWIVREKRFKAIGVVSAGNELVVGGSRVGVGTVAPTAAVLVIVTTAGYVLNVLLLFLGAGPSLRRVWAARSKNMRQRRRSVARTYRDFPLYREPQVLLNAVSMSMPAILLAAFFGPAVAGLYGLGRSVLQLPATLVSRSVGTVFLPHVAEKARTGENVTPFIVRATAGLAAVGLVPFGLIIVMGPQLFGAIFGSEWSTAGEYARWLSLWVYFAFANVPCVQAIPSLGLQGQFLVYEVATTVLRIGALIAGAILFKAALVSLILFSVIGALCNMVLILWVSTASRKSRRKQF